MPPFIIRKMTRLALGLKCSPGRTPPVPPVGMFGAAAACASDVFSICDSATRPKPPPRRVSAWRRVNGLKM